MKWVCQLVGCQREGVWRLFAGQKSMHEEYCEKHKPNIKSVKQLQEKTSR